MTKEQEADTRRFVEERGGMPGNTEVRRILASLDYEREQFAELRKASADRQAALEIIGRAIDELLPDFRASGTVVEHASAVRLALVVFATREVHAAWTEYLTNLDAGPRPTDKPGDYDRRRTLLHVALREAFVAAARTPTRVVYETLTAG